MTVANGSAGKIKHLPVIGIVPSQNTTEKMVSFPERYANAIIKACLLYTSDAADE